MLHGAGLDIQHTAIENKSKAKNRRVMLAGPESSSDGESEAGGETIADKLQRKYLEDEQTAARQARYIN